jgi:thioredoxin-like negative regulator of GroEL
MFDSPHVILIKNRQEYEDFKRKHRRSVILYGADWCEACSEMHDIFQRIANRYHEYVTLGYVDIDECNLEFSAVPIFVSLRKGQQLNALEGADRASFKQLVKEIIQAK